MTVNELIKELMELAENGYGEAKVEIVPSDVYSSGIDSIVEEEVKVNKNGDKKKKVLLYQE